MCGRFALRANRHDIRALNGNNIDVEEWDGEDDFVPRYNIAPRTQAPVVRRRENTNDNAGEGSSSNTGSGSNTSTQDSGSTRVIMQTMKWGLVPHWSKVEDKSLNTINARAESLQGTGGIWNSIKGSKRCAVPCQGYYEWLTKGKEKLPHFLKRKDGNLLLMAGLYDSAVIDGQTIWSFAIVTTEANSEFSWLHERQPVFLTSKDALDKWLDTSTPQWTDTLAKMVLTPYSDTSTPLECYQVPKEVGKVGTESPTFIEPVATRKDGIQAMFAKQTQAQQHNPSSPQKRSNKRSDPENEKMSPTKGPKREVSPSEDSSVLFNDSSITDLNVDEKESGPSTPLPSSSQKTDTTVQLSINEETPRTTFKRHRTPSPTKTDKSLDEYEDTKSKPSKRAKLVEPKSRSTPEPSTSSIKKEPAKSPRKPKPSPKKSPKKEKGKVNEGGSAKITAFFGKK